MLYNLFENRDFVSVFAVALLAEGVDRNTTYYLSDYALSEVALLAEGVDRNIYTPGEKTGMVLVALLAEGVDRNSSANMDSTMSAVALLAEGVDRNRSNATGTLDSWRRPPRGGRG